MSHVLVLEVLTGPQAGSVVRLPLDRDLLIGSSRRSDVLAAGPGVSFSHAVVRCEGLEATVSAKASTAGTQVNGQEVKSHGSRTLRVGDLVRVGELQVRLALADGATAPAAPAPKASSPTDRLAVQPAEAAPAAPPRKAAPAEPAEPAEPNDLALEVARLRAELEATRAERDAARAELASTRALLLESEGARAALAGEPFSPPRVEPPPGSRSQLWPAPG